MRTQVAPRPVGVLQGLEASVNPVAICPSFHEIADGPLAEQGRRAARPRAPAADRRRARRGDGPPRRAGGARSSPASTSSSRWPTRSTTSRAPIASIAALAAARGVSPVEEVLDLLLEDDGRQLLYMTLFNYAHGNLDDVREMLLSPNSVIGLCDAGAHCGAICDASFPTTAAVPVDAAGRDGPADRADGPPPHPAHRPPGRLARPRRARARATSPTSTSSTSTASPPTGRTSSTTCPPAAAGCAVGGGLRAHDQGRRRDVRRRRAHRRAARALVRGAQPAPA